MQQTSRYSQLNPRNVLIDNHGRKINYLRLAVTDRCNLRCFYCMPEHGIDWLSRTDLMSYEEMLRITSLLVHNGITKIRITGGEPFVRKDIMAFIAALSDLSHLQELTLTTNGVLTAPYIPELKKYGISSVNLSLDTINRERFFTITRRDELPAVMNTLQELLSQGIAVKLNAVVMNGKNTQDILPLVQLTKDMPVSVRFIEEMPFNGSGNAATSLTWDYIKILDTITQAYPHLSKLPDPPYSTSYNYHIPGHKGNIGIIAAYTRSFCGTCNRIRITPQGMLKTCLYDGGVLNIRDLVRQGNTDEQIMTSITNAIHHRAKDGHEAEKNSVHESMAAIGG